MYPYENIHTVTENYIWIFLDNLGYTKYVIHSFKFLQPHILLAISTRIALIIR